MPSESPIIAVSQRVVEVASRGEVRDCLDQEWTRWLQALGFNPLPVPNRLESVAEFLGAIRPAGIVLTGGNNLTLPVYDGSGNETVVADAFETRDHTEQGLVEYALRSGVPLLGCCRGMQFLQAFFGGRLSNLQGSPVTHVARDHEAAIIDARFQELAGTSVLTVNSFHNFGIHPDAVAGPFVPFAQVPADSTVEGFWHREAPIVGIMWHPERRNPAAAFDRELARRLFALLPPFPIS